MTAYLKWRGLPETILSMYRGAGAVSGIASTLVFPALRSRFGEHSPQCAPVLRVCTVLCRACGGHPVQQTSSAKGAGACCRTWLVFKVIVTRLFVRLDKTYVPLEFCCCAP